MTPELEQWAVTVPFHGGTLTHLVPWPIAAELNRLRGMVTEQMEGRQRALDRCDRLLDKLERASSEAAVTP